MDETTAPTSQAAAQLDVDRLAAAVRDARDDAAPFALAAAVILIALGVVSMHAHWDLLGHRLWWLWLVVAVPYLLLSGTLLLGLGRLIRHDRRREIAIALLALVWVFNVLGVLLLVISLVAHSGTHMTGRQLLLSEHAERSADLLPRLRCALDVVPHPAELELAVVSTQRVRRTHVTVQRHACATGVDERRAVRPGPAELLVAVAEDDDLVADAVQHPLVVLAGLGREALDVRKRRAVDIEDTVLLELRLQRVEPALVSPQAGVALRERLHHFGPIRRRLTQPALSVAANPGRVRQFAQPLDRLARP